MGIFDNLATMRREVYHNRPDDPVLSISAQVIETKPEYGGMAGLMAPWGSYPDVPKREGGE